MKTLTVILLVVFTGCSSDTKYYREDGICYSRKQDRVFGLKIFDYKSKADPDDCRE